MGDREAVNFTGDREAVNFTGDREAVNFMGDLEVCAAVFCFPGSPIPYPS